MSIHIMLHITSGFLGIFNYFMGISCTFHLRFTAPADFKSPRLLDKSAESSFWDHPTHAIRLDQLVPISLVFDIIGCTLVFS